MSSSRDQMAILFTFLPHKFKLMYLGEIPTHIRIGILIGY